MWVFGLYLLLDLMLGWSVERETRWDDVPDLLWGADGDGDVPASWLVSGEASDPDFPAKLAEATQRARAAKKARPKKPLPAPFVPVAVIALCRAMAEASGAATEEHWSAMERVLRGHKAFAKFRPEGMAEMLARASRHPCQGLEQMVGDLRFRFPPEQLPAILHLLDEVMRADGRVWAAERDLLAKVGDWLAPFLPKTPATPVKGS
ncbi:TerB family tellurite resistance protein [bacterium]|nr:TerB family tellurite resistance protein [bacterium]